MAVFPSDSIRTKDWGSEVLTDSDLETQFDLLHSYFQACLNATTGHAHTGASNQGPKISPANLLIASQETGDLLYASSATAWARLAKGTASQFLTMKSDATIPEWSSAASVAEVKTGTDSTKPVPTASLIGHEGIVKGWINMNGTGTIAINDSFNVSGITDNGTGDYTVTWDADFGDANYALTVSTPIGGTDGTPTLFYLAGPISQAAGSCRICTHSQNGSSSYPAHDANNMCVIAIGDR